MSKAIVIYDTKYGNTKKVAEAIALGIEGEGIEVDLKNVSETSPAEIAKYELIVLGSPTHIGSVKKDTKKLLKGLKDLDLSHAKFAAFDTRFKKASKGATKKIETIMEKYGASKVVDGLGVEVTGMKGPLEGKAEEKSKAFGAEIAQKSK